jgi:hypothetical protein
MTSGNKTNWKDMSLATRAWISAVTGVSLVLVAAAERDIQRRPADQLRGSKPLWRLVCLNGLGAINYFLWGRRSGSDG